MRAGWTQITCKVVLYDLALAGLRHALQMIITPWISTGNNKSEKVDQLLDCAGSSQFKPNDKMPGGQYQKRQAGEFQKGGDKKHNF